MNIEEIKARVRLAAKSISDSRLSIWSSSEQNICSHLRERMQPHFLEYDIDVELVKYTRERPDIVIHHYGNDSDNFVVFEVKKKPSLKEFVSDLRKIESTFFGEPYNYQYGILICVGKIPENLPPFDTSRIGIIEVYGWALDTTPPRKLTL